jgi:glycine cleavage system H protein
MPDFLQFTVDKFTFKVAADRSYSPEGLWALPEGDRVRLGLSDFLQQHSGDVAFAELKPAGTHLATGDELAVIETIKVNLSLASPISGKVLEVNPVMASRPEAINQDPYGEGWLVIAAPDDWEAERARLLDPEAYLAKAKREAEEEAGSK